MNTYTPNSTIDCYIVVPPQYRPQIYTGVSFLNGNNLRAILTVTERKNENRIEKSDGSIDIFKRGLPRKDLSLQITGSDAETELVIEEIINRNIPVYIYPRSGGNLQLDVPLVRGLGIDPVDAATATYVLTTSATTTIYMPKADSGHGVYLEAIDTAAPLIDGVYTSNGAQSQFPTGRGMPFMGLRKNLLKESLMSSIAYEAPYTAGAEWGAYTSASDVWGTDHGTRDSIWCADAKTYWTKSATTTLKSYTFPIVSTYSCNFSCCYRVNGSMSIALRDSGGNARWSKAVSSGSGRMMETFILAVTGAGAYLEFTLASGSYMEISCPQFLNVNGIDITEYQPFLGTATTEAEVTANSLSITCDMGADNSPYTATTADRDGAVFASGYFQPQMSEDYGLAGSVFCSMIGYDATVSGYIGVGGGSTFIFGLQTDKTSRDTAEITGHVIGDIYAWGLYSGYNSGTAASRLYCVRLRDGATYTNDYAAAIMWPYQIVIGADEDLAYQADGVIGAVTVESCTWSDCRTAVGRLADSAVLNVIRDTVGRQYTLSRNISPKKYKSDANAGTYSATEVKAV